MNITTMEFQKFILFEITKFPQSDKPETGDCFLEVKIAKLKQDSDKQYSDKNFNASDIDFIPLKTAKTHFDVLFANKAKLGYPLDQKTVLKYIVELYDKGFLQKNHNITTNNGMFKDENEIKIDLIEYFLNKKENEDKPVRFKINKMLIDFKNLEPLEEWVKQHKQAILESLITKLEFERYYKESNIVLSDIDLELFYKTLSFRKPIESTHTFLQDRNNKDRIFIIINFELIVDKKKLKNIMSSNLNHLSNVEVDSKINSTFDLFKKFNEGLFKWVLTHFLQLYRFENKLDLSNLGLFYDITTQKSDNKLTQIVGELFFSGNDKIAKYNNKFIFLCEAKILVFMPYLLNKAIKEALTDFAIDENSKTQKFLKDFAEQERLNLPLKLEEKKYNEDLFNDLDDIKSVIDIFSESDLKEIYNDIIEREKIKYNKCYPHALNELPCEGNYDELSKVFCSHNIRDIIKNDLKYNIVELEKKENDEVVNNIIEEHSQKTEQNVSQEQKSFQETETKEDEIINKTDNKETTDTSLSQINQEEQIPQQDLKDKEDEKLDNQDTPNQESVNKDELKQIEGLNVYQDEFREEEPFPEGFNANAIQKTDNLEDNKNEQLETKQPEELNEKEAFEKNSQQEKLDNTVDKYIRQNSQSDLENKIIEKDEIIKELRAKVKLLDADERLRKIEEDYSKIKDELRLEIENKNNDIKELQYQLSEKNIALERIKQKLVDIEAKNEELKNSTNNNEEVTKIHFANFLKLYINIPLNTDEYEKNIYLLSLLSCASKADNIILNNYIDFMLEKNKIDIDKFTEGYSNFLKKLDIEDKKGLDRTLKTIKSDVRAGLLSMLDFFKDCFEYDDIENKTKISKESDTPSTETKTEVVLKNNSEKNNNGLLNKILDKFDFRGKNKKISNSNHVSMIFDILIYKPYYNKNIANAIVDEITIITTDILEKNKTTFQNLSINKPNLKEQREDEIKKKKYVVLKYELLIVVYKDILVYDKFNNILQKELLKKLNFDIRFKESIFHS